MAGSEPPNRLLLEFLANGMLAPPVMARGQVHHGSQRIEFIEAEVFAAPDEGGPQQWVEPLGAGDLALLLERADVIAFGPGLGRSRWAGELFAAMAGDERPAVLDADALNWLAETPAEAPQRIITPHPGEAGTLLGISAASVQADRRKALGDLQSRYGGVAVLKGSGSLVSSASGAPWLCPAGNPGMAAAGMGDVLTGVIAALLAQGLEPELAARVGVELHARAGDRAASRGERGLLASDLIAELRGLVNP